MRVLTRGFAYPNKFTVPNVKEEKEEEKEEERGWGKKKVRQRALYPF